MANLLKTFAQAGCIDEEVIPLFFEDMIYRVQELVTNAYQFTKHGKRVKLTCDDINKALSISDTPKIYGHGHDKKPLEDVFCAEADVWFVQEEPVDLVALSESIINKTYRVNLVAGSPQYRIDWLQLGTKVKYEYEQHRTSAHDKFIDAFNCITKGLMSKDPKTYKATLDGLSSLPNIQHILPHLVKYLSTKITKGTEIKVVRQLIWAIHGLCKNPHIHLASESHAGPLIASLINCILNNPTSETFSDAFVYDHWSLKDFSSYVLCQLLKYWNSSFVYSKVYNQVIRSFLDCLKDQSGLFISYYGSLIAFHRLGFDCIMTNLAPYFLSFCNFLFQIIENDIFVDKIAKNHAYCTLGALNDLAFYLMLKFRNNLVVKNACDNPYFIKEILSIFGDRISAMMPTDTHELTAKLYTYRKPPDPDRQPSGYELLDTFYEKYHHEDNESASLSSDSKDDDRSNESEKGLTKHDGTDLRVQSTISDPTLGVKLTIKKVRRPRKSIEEIQGSAALSQKRNAKNIKNTMALFSQECQDVLREEQVLRGMLGKMVLFPLDKHDFNDDLIFSGRLSCKKLRTKTQKNLFTPSSYYLLAKNMKFVLKLPRYRFFSQEERWRRKMMSCSISIIV